MENPIHRFFSSVNRDMMHFALSPMISKQGAKLSYASWSANTVPELVSYIASESYLRIDNRPIVFDWQLPFRSAEEHKAALTQLRQAIQARLGTEPLVLVVLSGDDDYDKFVRLRDAWGVDGATCFGIHISGAPEPYSEMVRQGIRQTSKQATTQQGRVDSGMIYVPCGSTGIDARPWFRVGGFPRYDRGPDVRPRTTMPTVQEFREHLANIRSFINRHRVRTLNMVTSTHGTNGARRRPRSSHRVWKATPTRILFAKSLTSSLVQAARDTGICEVGLNSCPRLLHRRRLK